MNETNNMTYFSKSLHEIPWHLPLFRISLTFPDNSLTLKKLIFPDFSLTRGNPACVGTGKWFKIESRQIAFLWWNQDSNRASQTPTRQQTKCSLTNRLRLQQWQIIDGQNVVRFGISVAMTLFSPCQLYRFFIRRMWRCCRAATDAEHAAGVQGLCVKQRSNFISWPVTI